MIKLCKINACPNGTLGLHLSRAPWDPYPWVSDISDGSSAQLAGIKIGDTVLECNGIDVLGWKISELANKIHNYWNCGGKMVNFLIWRNQQQINENDSGHNINQQSLQKFANCLQNIAQLLECPVCLEIIKPPGWQCCNGHVLCNCCRYRTIKCPICRVTLGPRGRCLLSDKLFTLLAETFPCDVKNDNKNVRCPEENHKIKRIALKAVNRTSSASSSPTVTTTTTVPDSQSNVERNIFLMEKSIQNHHEENYQSQRIQQMQNITTTTSTLPTLESSLTPAQQANGKFINFKNDENQNDKQVISIKMIKPQVLPVPVPHKPSVATVTTTKLPVVSTSSVVTILNHSVFSTSIPVSVLTAATTTSSSSSSLSLSQVTITTMSCSTSSSAKQGNFVENFPRYYYCPTGKSCIVQKYDDLLNPINFSTNVNINDINNSCSSCIIYPNIYEKNQNIQWNYLTHLRRVHQLSVCQYYCYLNEEIPIDLNLLKIQNSSLLCITIDMSSSIIMDIDKQKEQTIKSSRNLQETKSITLKILRTDDNDHNIQNGNCKSLKTKHFVLSETNSNSSTNSFKNCELFFIVVMPLENYNNNDNNKIITNMKNVTAATKISDNNVSSSTSSYNNNNVNAVTAVFKTNILPKDMTATTPTTKTENNDIFYDSNVAIINNRNFPKYLPDASHHHLKHSNSISSSSVVVDDDDDDAKILPAFAKRSSTSSLSSLTTTTDIMNSFTTTASTLRTDVITTAVASSSTGLLTASGSRKNQQCALFIWYCGDECNIKNFQVIMKYKDVQNSTNSLNNNMEKCWLHPVTKSWNLIKNQKEFLKFNIDDYGNFVEFSFD